MIQPQEHLLLQAFEIADEIMWATLEIELMPIDDHETVWQFLDGDANRVNSLTQTHQAVQEAVQWLRARGYVELSTDDSGEFLTVNRRVGDEG